MKKLFAGLFVVFLAGFAVNAQAQAVVGVIQTAPESIRAAAILTTSDVYTTFTAPTSRKCNYVVFHISYTKGSLDSAYVWPCGAVSSNPADTGYYKSLETSVSLTDTGRYVYRVPREAFGGYGHYGIILKGTGTADNSSMTVYKSEEYTAN